MANYKGYFRSLKNVEYEVKIITDSASTAYTEVLLAGEQPFVVTYEDSDHPFSPVRISTATISFVSDDYLLDIYPIHAQDTQVQLINKNTSTIEWLGYIKPFTYNQGYENCVETIEVQASDCLASLQYYDYTTVGTDKKICTVKDILLHVVGMAGCLDGYFITSGKTVNGTALDLEKLAISEKNFFSDDVEEEPWKANEVLEEICKYLGFCAVQWRNKLYLLDNQLFCDTERLSGKYYALNATGATPMTLPAQLSIVEGSYMGNGGNISFEQVYSKASVADSFYFVDSLIPDMFDDELLTNKLGDMWECEEVPYFTQYATYVNSHNQSKQEDTPDDKYSYYKRVFKHKNYTPVYRNNSGTIVSDNGMVTTTIVSKSVSDTESKCTAVFKNNDSVSHTVYAYAWIKATWWDEEWQIMDQAEDEDDATFTLSAGESVTKTLEAEIIEADYPATVGNELNYSVDGGALIEIGKSPTPETTYLGGTIVDFASVENGNFATYNYETASDINFNRYLMIYQGDYPTGNQNPRSSAITLDTQFPAVFKLNSGYTNPVAVDEDSFLVLNCSALFERYRNRPYINPEWLGQCTGIGGGYNVYKWGIITGTKQIITTPPALVFKLGIGNKYWNGSAWTTTNCAFYVDMSTPTNADGSIDYSSWWNTESKVLNNVPWQDWAGVKGYKIPIDTSLDFNQPITFEIHFPSKLQYYVGGSTNDGFNNYCWIKDLSIKVAHKGSAKNTEKKDKKYENVIDEGSVNELSEETFKITTYDNENMVSYSNMLVNTGTTISPAYTFLKTIIENHLSGNAQTPEENYVERMVNQYSSLTKKERLTLDLTFSPLSRIIDTWWNEKFVILGQEIDYAYDRQSVFICQIKEDTGVPDYANINVTAATFSSAATTYNASISANVEWTLVVDTNDWLSATADSGTTGNKTFQIKATANPAEVNRTGHIIVYRKSDGVEMSRMTVTQKAKYVNRYVKFNITSKSVASGATAFTASVSASTTWNLSGDTIWLNFGPTTGNAGNTTITVNVAANSVTSARTGHIYARKTDGTTMDTMTITQAAKSSATTMSFNMANHSRLDLRNSGTLMYGGDSKTIVTLNDTLMFDVDRTSDAEYRLPIRNSTTDDIYVTIYKDSGSSTYYNGTINAGDWTNVNFTVPAADLQDSSINIVITE